MRKEIKIILVSLIIFVVFGLNLRFGKVPPLGRLLSPFTGYLQNDFDNVQEGEIEINGLESVVKITFDGRAVPHVFANKEEDLYFVQGYLHASERLWQMDFISRAASGRLSEVVGNATLDMDRITRRKALVSSAEKSLGYIKSEFPHTYKMFEAYSKGVNAFIAGADLKKLPIEFKLMDYEPEEWSPLKIVLIQKYFANMLAGYDADAERTNALNFFGNEEFDKIYNNELADIVPMVDSSDAGCFVNTPKTECRKIAGNIPKEMYPKDKYQPDPGYGSNTWVVSAKRSESGYPILANDPHLSFTLPSIWYEIQLVSDSCNVYGVSIPGAPFVIIGFNKDIAWGITSGQTDLKDWHALKLRNGNTEYLHNGKWLKTIKHPEKIKVFGSADVSDTVMYTEIGPIVSDELFKPDAAKVNMALKWVAHSISNDFYSFYLLNKAKNYNDYERAVEYIVCPSLNFSFASKNDIAITHQGQIPIRENHAGEFIVNGNYMEAEESYIPRKSLPKIKNPPKGFVFSANQKPVYKNYPFSFYGYYDMYRNRSINKWLSDSSEKITADDMMKLQLDNYNLLASDALPLMADNINRELLTEQEKKLLGQLKSWDFRDDKGSVLPFLFFRWWTEFYPGVWDEITQLKNPVLLPSAGSTLRLLKDEPRSRFFDVASTNETESASQLLAITFKKAIAGMEKENGKLVDWGKAKKTQFTHLGKIPAFSSEILECNGSRYSVNASGTDWGPGWRMIVELGEKRPAHAWGMNPGGQSGNPGSRYYNSDTHNWANGKYNELYFIMPGDKESPGAKKLILK